MSLASAFLARQRSGQIAAAMVLGTCCGLLSLLMLPAVADAEQALAIDSAQLIELARLDDAALTKLRAGGVVQLREVSESKGDSDQFDLYSGMAIIIDTPASTVVEVIGRPEWAGAGIPGAVGSFIDKDIDFPPAVFGNGDAEEVRRILKGKDSVNISNAELTSLRALKLTEPFDRAELRKFGTAYTDMLRSRYESYLGQGLAGITPYEEGRDSWSPAEHFRVINEFWNPWLPQILPMYADELSLPPDELNPVLKQEFLLVRKPIGARPIFSLVHRFGRHNDDVFAIIHREFFVGGEYGAMQVILIGAPYEGSTLMVLGSDAFTEQVAGFGSGMKHRAGRKTMQDIFSGMLLELRAQALQTSRPQ